MLTLNKFLRKFTPQFLGDLIEITFGIMIDDEIVILKRVNKDNLQKHIKKFNNYEVCDFFISYPKMVIYIKENKNAKVGNNIRKTKTKKDS